MITNRINKTTINAKPPPPPYPPDIIPPPFNISIAWYRTIISSAVHKFSVLYADRCVTETAFILNLKQSLNHCHLSQQNDAPTMTNRMNNTTIKANPPLYPWPKLHTSFVFFVIFYAFSLILGVLLPIFHKLACRKG